jgi:hypothetical protein
MIILIKLLFQDVMKHLTSRILNCLCLREKPAQLGPIDRGSPYFRIISLSRIYRLIFVMALGMFCVVYDRSLYIVTRDWKLELWNKQRRQMLRNGPVNVSWQLVTAATEAMQQQGNCEMFTTRPTTLPLKQLWRIVYRQPMLYPRT